MHRGGKPPQCNYIKVRLQNQDEQKTFERNFQIDWFCSVAYRNCCWFIHIVYLKETIEYAGESQSKVKFVLTLDRKSVV